MIAPVMFQRRLLVNATVEADRLPRALRPVVVADGLALVGVCVVRSSPRACRFPTVEALAYRVAATDDDGGPTVRVVRRETADRRALAVARLGLPLRHDRVALRSSGDVRVEVEGATDDVGPDLLLDFDEPTRTGDLPWTSVLGHADEAAAFFGAAQTATDAAGDRLHLVAAPFPLQPLRPRRLRLDRLAWAFGVDVGDLTFDSAYVARDVPVRVRIERRAA